MDTVHCQPAGGSTPPGYKVPGAPAVISYGPATTAPGPWASTSARAVGHAVAVCGEYKTDAPDDDPNSTMQLLDGTTSDVTPAAAGVFVGHVSTTPPDGWVQFGPVLVTGTKWPGDVQVTPSRTTEAHVGVALAVLGVDVLGEGATAGMVVLVVGADAGLVGAGAGEGNEAAGGGAAGLVVDVVDEDAGGDDDRDTGTVCVGAVVRW
jgi:hypothetical protein